MLVISTSGCLSKINPLHGQPRRCQMLRGARRSHATRTSYVHGASRVRNRVASHYREDALLVIGYVLGRSRRLDHVEHVRRRLGKFRSAGARRGATTLRLHRGFLQSFQVGGQKGRRFAASGIVLAQEAFETEDRVRLCYALRRFMTRRATGRVKLGGSLTSVQIFLRAGTCEEQR
jgi:hypothetical protein